MKIKKFMKVQMSNKEIEFRLDTSSELILINEQSWKKIGRPTLLQMEKIPHCITGNKLKFVGECYSNVTFMGKTLKLKGLVMN